ncbi:hypothetical protein [Demequina rhizosphaerae]|uniref:hypothetical protein n=1 Tax=Demequina rhizosphaerae TaxID=1638985 RepID=UPI0012E0AD7F|nr:hypothetical protein [Demequina rhizosphaerae]
MPRLDSRILDVASPVSWTDLRLIGSGVQIVQFQSALTKRDYRRLAEALRRHPEVRLRAYGSYDGSITNLDFLEHFPELRRFSADALYHSLTNIEGLRFLPDDVESLTIGQTKKRLSVAPLHRFKNLTHLYLEGQTKDIDVISELQTLQSLTLRSITLPGLSMLHPLHNLRALDLKLGGTKDLSELPNVGRLEYLELWMVKGLSDLSPVADLASLDYLFLQSLRQVDTLPPMNRLTALTRVWLETMKGLTDLSPLRDAPQLRQLALIEMPHLAPDAVKPLIGHPTLTTLRAGLGSKRKNDAVAELLPLASDGDWREPVRL